MQVFTPGEIAHHAANKYLGVLIAAKYARVLNEFPRDRSSSREKKLTTRSLEELAFLNIALNAGNGWVWQSHFQLVGPTSA